MKKVWNKPTLVELKVSKTETGRSHHCEYGQPGQGLPHDKARIVGGICPGAPS